MNITSSKLKECNISYEECVYCNYDENIIIRLGISFENIYYIKYYTGSEKIFSIGYNEELSDDIKLCRISLLEPVYIGEENNYKLNQLEKENLIKILNSPHQDYKKYKTWDWIIKFTNIIHDSINEWTYEEKEQDKFISIPKDLKIPDYTKL